MHLLIYLPKPSMHLISSPYGHLAYMGERKSACTFLVGEPEGNIPLGRRRHRRDTDIEMDLQEM
jgi:hypothetical protein